MATGPVYVERYWNGDLRGIAEGLGLLAAPGVEPSQTTIKPSSVAIAAARRYLQQALTEIPEEQWQVNSELIEQETGHNLNRAVDAAFVIDGIAKFGCLRDVATWAVFTDIEEGILVSVIYAKGWLQPQISVEERWQRRIEQIQHWIDLDNKMKHQLARANAEEPSPTKTTTPTARATSLTGVLVWPKDLLRVPLEQLERRVPQVNKADSASWRVATDLAGFEVVEISSLRRQRSGGQKTADELFGVDEVGRIWRKNGKSDRDVWYYVPSARRNRDAEDPLVASALQLSHAD